MAKGKGTYTAVHRIKTGGKRYMPGDAIELDEAEAKRMGTAVQKGGKAREPNEAAPAGGDGGTAGGAGGALDPSLFTPAALNRARELKITDMGRTEKRAADGAKWGVEDVDRRHEKQGDDE